MSIIQRNIISLSIIIVSSLVSLNRLSYCNPSNNYNLIIEKTSSLKKASVVIESVNIDSVSKKIMCYDGFVIQDSYFDLYNAFTHSIPDSILREMAENGEFIQISFMINNEGKPERLTIIYPNSYNIEDKEFFMLFNAIKDSCTFTINCNSKDEFTHILWQVGKIPVDNIIKRIPPSINYRSYYKDH
jgi:hypothetical protein